MKVKIKDLLFSELSKSIYSHEPPDDLVRSISENGLLVPIWVSEDNIVISGHRRVRACQKLGIEDIEAEVREYSDTLVIEANRYREKTWQEKLKEAEALEGILKKQAKERQGTRTDITKNSGECYGDSHIVQNSSQGEYQNTKTRQKVSKSIGTSFDTLNKVKTIAKEKPELLAKIDEGVRSVHSVYNQILQEKQKEINQNNKPLPLPAGKYRTIVIDPPWPMEIIIREIRPNQTITDYPTLSISEITNLPIKDITTNECHLYLWTTQKFLPISFSILESWGFTYIFTMVWHKNGGFQPVKLPQYNCEFVLFGRKGGLDFLDTKQFFTCFFTERGRHSEKPDLFYDLIKRVSPEPRLDMFSRKQRDGFEQYGDEAEYIS